MSRATPFPMLVSTDWLADHLHDPELRILDSTTVIERDPAGGADRVFADRSTFEAGHIPGAQFVDLQRDLSDPTHPLQFMLPTADHFARSLERFGIGETTRVVVYSSGNVWWATRVWWLLRVFGFHRAAVLDGGLKAWLREGRPVETGPARKVMPAGFTARPAHPLTAAKENVLAAIGDPGTCTVNALPAASHSGATPSSYGRSGHITGSVSVPGIELIDPATNRFLALDQIEQRFRSAGVLGKDRVIAYCGGGITATAIAFALALLGRPDPLIYDASLQEWAADRSLPMNEQA